MHLKHKSFYYSKEKFTFFPEGLEFYKDSAVHSANLAVQLIGADAKPCGRRLCLSVGSSVCGQQVQSPHGVNVEVFLQSHSSFQHTDGISRLLL